ncbi:hypothetical protein D0T84_20955 [Dysgonomonas sp. 521]|uniref:hypothetical protein n=1 Tax=Dysgonomonas sp. 521 TaxID=2302932 RepID=UPI0013D3AFBB|nr:hypothetical protein [Dysgonomonas sp. 521]NDV97348.1 hypothetical protein [Dysgonomonas sp. 521]
MKRYKLLFIVFVFIFIMLILFGVFLFITKQNKREYNHYYGQINVQFFGRILEQKTVSRLGRDRTVICIKLNYSNIDSIRILDEKHFLRIEKNMASMVIAPEYSNLDSISFNVNNNGMVEYFICGKLLSKHPLSLSLSYSYLNINDLENCFPL